MLSDILRELDSVHDAFALYSADKNGEILVLHRTIEELCVQIKQQCAEIERLRDQLSLSYEDKILAKIADMYPRQE